ncbi:MAG TPA: hypothetical protein VNN12_04450 [Dehalococcoidia bacterium]|jgi:hypothetical protein|nr:hypothetical protein [Dehalococcoidia bacterium]
MISFELEHNARLAALMIAGELAYAALLVGLLAGSGAEGAVVTAFLAALPVMMSLWSAMALLAASGDWDTPAALKPAALTGVLAAEAAFVPLVVFGPPGDDPSGLFSLAQGQVLAVALGLGWGTAVAAALPFTTGERIRFDQIAVTALAGLAGALAVPAAWALLLAARVHDALAFRGGDVIEAVVTGAVALPVAFLCGRVSGLAHSRIRPERPGVSRIYDAR